MLTKRLGTHTMLSDCEMRDTSRVSIIPFMEFAPDGHRLWRAVSPLMRASPAPCEMHTLVALLVQRPLRSHSYSLPVGFHAPRPGSQRRPTSTFSSLGGWFGGCPRSTPSAPCRGLVMHGEEPLAAQLDVASGPVPGD